MKIAILGTGMVGKALGTKLVSIGHEVRMGSRTADNEAATAWAAEAGDGASHGTFADANGFGEVVINCIGGVHTLAALEAAGDLGGKVLIDISNPLDFSQGFPPFLSVCNTESLAEQIQAAHPEAKVVKTLNTVANHLMIDPGQLNGGDHTLFVNGNDADAKAQVTGWLNEWFGWTDVVDMGDITTARGTEAWLLMWTRLYSALGHANFNIKLAR